MLISRSNQIICLFIIVFLIINPYSKRLVYDYGKAINHIKLPDLFHHEKINLKHLSPLNDMMAGIILLYTLYHMLISKNILPNDVLLFAKYLIIAKIIKMILMTVTVLPDASGQCNIYDKLQNPLKFYFMSGCNDLVFSFHMAVVLFCVYFLFKNGIISKTTGITLSVIQAILILTTQNHYTLDVLLAFIIVPYIVSGKYHIFA
jgi:hypothetical protein